MCYLVPVSVYSNFGLGQVGSGLDSVISDEACFGLVPEGVSYRSDYS